MKVLLVLLLLLQSVKMTEDFLPLESGNKWIYDVSTEAGQKLAPLEFSLGERKFVSGRSVYAVSGFPFGGEITEPVGLIGYDRETRQFFRISGGQEIPLFPGDSQSTEIIQSDSSGIPQKFSLNTGSTTLVFQRGVGIIEAKMKTSDGIRTARIRSSSIGAASTAPLAASSARAAAPAPPATAATAVSPVAEVSAENPVLIVSSQAVPGGLKLELLVVNTANKLLPFKFNSSRTYDFFISDPATGREVWRWSNGNVFGQIVRSDSIRGNSKWTYSEVWNRKDNDRNPVPPGRYSLVGVLSSQPPIQSQAVMIEVQ